MNGKIATVIVALALAAGVSSYFRGDATAPRSGTAARALETPLPPPPPVRRADFGGEVVSPEVRHVADWAVHSGDHQNQAFIIVDKVNAKAVVFDAEGRLVRTTPILIGMGRGDIFPAGMGDVDMYTFKPSERITPAGRYVAEEGLNTANEIVLWVDYDNGIALHKMPTRKTKQRRHERMFSPDPAQHRITYGCINVPPAFYDDVVRPHFRSRGGIVYVLPDSTPVQSVFRSYDVNAVVAASRKPASAGQITRTSGVRY